jgi:Secretion system C-terminal sorting domain
MKQIIFLIFALTSVAKTYAQCPAGTVIDNCTLQYKYDNAGNRIERSFQVCACITSPPGGGGGGGGGTGRYAGTSTTETNSATAGTSSLLEISSIAPNPTTNGVVVQFSATVQKGSIFITDATGKLLGEQAVSGTTWDIDLSAYASGMYYLTLRTEGSIQTKKVVKTD